MTNKKYDTLKTIALIIAPVTVFFSTIADIWGIPYGAQITATLAACDVLMGAIVVIAKRNYEAKLKATETLQAPYEQEEEE